MGSTFSRRLRLDGSSQPRLGGQGFFGLYHLGIWKLIRQGDFDAVLCYTGYLRASFWIALAAARMSGAAVLLGTDASSLAPRDSRAGKVTVKKFIWPSLFRLAGQLIVPSGAAAAMMRSLGLPEDRVTLTPFVADRVLYLHVFQASSIQTGTLARV